ncbi:hypothetical protein MTO96_032111 [Rhipicephalus appendiculatus]
MENIVYNILNDQPPPRGLLERSTAMPFLELQGAESAEAMPRPGAIKTHLPFHLQPYSKEAKYIYITRNPYDCCVSFYYHAKGDPDSHFENGTFDEFLDRFLEGRVDFGDYFEHVLSWYAHRFDENVLFVTYEDLKKDKAKWIIRIAEFIGEKYGRELRHNKNMLARVIDNTSVEHMRSRENEAYRKRKEDMKYISEQKKPRWMKLPTPRPDDIFIVSYPKCGTTWMQHIVYNILNNRPPPRTLLEQSTAMPFLEKQGSECARLMPRPGAIKTHMPFHLHPYSKQAKYIYITRNPYDCCVSFYYHTKGLPDYRFEDGTFDEFFDMFLDGNVAFGDYFEHVLSWYARRRDDNVLFVTYEDLKRDTAAWTIRIAEFIGKKYAYQLRHNNKMLARLVNNTGIQAMQECVNEVVRKVHEHMKSISEDVKPRWMKRVQETVGDDIKKKPVTADFVRKGVVGDWRNHFTPDQVIRMKRTIAVKTAGSDVMSLWEGIGLP